jgi:hypothetical protein
MYAYFALMILKTNHPLVWPGGAAAELPHNAKFDNQD